MAIITVKNRAITLDAAEIPNLDASKITSGSFADARIPNLATSKITSGTFAESFLVNATTDLQPIKSDITALALREATNESSASFNLPNQHIDTFATDTITKTNCSIVSGHCTTVIPAGFAVDTDGTLNTSLADVLEFDNNVTSTTGTSSFSLDGYNSYSTSTKKLGTHSIRFASNNHGLDINYNSTNKGKWTSSNQPYSISCWLYRDTDTSAWQMVYDGYRDGSSGTTHCIFGLDGNGSNNYRMSTLDGTNTWYYSSLTPSANAWQHCVFTLTTSRIKWYLNGTKQETTGSYELDPSHVDHRFFHRYNNDYGFRGYADQLCMWEKELSDQEATDLYNSGNGNAYNSLTANSTGTAIQAANTVGSAKTKVGGTLLYKNSAGTNTLGTDLKVYFSCNGGSNWTEAASYNAITPVYSTGVKQVRLGETTCTSGTDVRYKIEWANQANGSKVAQVHGIGINY